MLVPLCQLQNTKIEQTTFVHNYKYKLHTLIPQQLINHLHNNCGHHLLCIFMSAGEVCEDVSSL